MSNLAKTLKTLVIAPVLVVSGAAFACDNPVDYVELSRLRMASQIASVFPITGQSSKVNVTARLDSGDMIMMTVPLGSAEPGDALVVDRVTLEDRLENGEPQVHFDFVELLAD